MTNYDSRRYKSPFLEKVCSVAIYGYHLIKLILLRFICEDQFFELAFKNIHI